MVEPLGMGVVGAGAIGIRGALMHLSQPDVQDLVRLAAVCDPVPGRAEAAAQKYDVAASYETYEELLADPDVDMVYASQSVDGFAEKFYARKLDWKWPSRGWNKERFFSGSSLEIVPITAGILHLCDGNVNQSIVEVASFGRDCDTTASLAGAIAGAMQGASAIRQDWIETAEKGNAEFFEELEGDPNANFYHMAQRLVQVLSRERQAAQERANQLATLLEA